MVEDPTRLASVGRTFKTCKNEWYQKAWERVEKRHHKYF